jgi:phenylalanyl-tRNA synthetase alpha chain
MIERIEQLRAQASTEVSAAGSSDALEELRVRYLGRKAELPQILRGVAELEPERRGEVGKAANEARRALETLIEERAEELQARELEADLREDAVDVTLPGAPPQPIGALNHSPTHPARARSDTFYVTDDLVLRTHTSPMQVRAMETHPPPLYIIIPGRVFRPDSDATHTPQFHQVEGLAVDEDITLADLKGTLLAFARAVFGEDRDVRLRPHYFPFTEPSVEVDVSCFNCDGKGFLRDGSRCYLCKGEGWLEVLGAGEVDPALYSYVATNELNAPGYDPEKVQGFAWGMGIERIAMLKHGIPDLRLNFENDLRFLEQLP